MQLVKFPLPLRRSEVPQRMETTFVCYLYLHMLPIFNCLSLHQLFDFYYHEYRLNLPLRLSLALRIARQKPSGPGQDAARGQ